MINTKRMAGVAWTFATLFLTALTFAAAATEYKQPVGPPPPGCDHDRWGTQPRGIVREFRAFLVSFDDADDDDGDGVGDAWGIPEWVAYEIKGMDDPPQSGPDRPQPWLTDRELHEQDLAPADESYKNSGYDRGHLCQKLIAYRLGAEADWNSHTMLNACPQDPALNQGIWLDLERRTARWADAYGAVWVVCGPVFFDKRPRHWIGDPGEIPVAVPDAFFKIIIKRRPDSPLPDVLAFFYPHHRYRRGEPYDHRPFLVSVNRLEELTGLDFLSTLSDEDQAKVERQPAGVLWE